MSRTFTFDNRIPALASGKRRLLIKATSECWTDLIQSAKETWDVTRVLDDEQFTVELALGGYSVAAIEASSAYLPAESIQSSWSHATPSMHSSGWTQDPLGIEQGHPSVGQLLVLNPDTASLSESVRDAAWTDHVLTTISPTVSRPDFLRWLEIGSTVFQLVQQKKDLRQRLLNRHSPLVGCSGPVQRLREQIQCAAEHDWPVLIHGERGTGRDLAARAIHEASSRSDRPLIKIDCRVHSSMSLSHELFGGPTERAFEAAGAARLRIDGEHSFRPAPHFPSRLELADGGVLILDGIEEVALPLQAVLADVIERKAFQVSERAKETPLDARIIAISSRDLKQLTATGQFREDLLKHFVGPILRTPPLREILTDVILLSEHLLKQISGKLGIGPIRLLPETTVRLQSHRWPGNVTELESLLERACLLRPGGGLTPEMIDQWLTGTESTDARLPGLTLAQMERQLIEATFTRCAGNRELTANSLQIGLRTLSGKLREYGYPPRGGPGSNRRNAERDAA